MKKQKKQFVIMLALLVVCVAAFVVLTIYNKKQEQLENKENDTIALVDVAAEDIFAFSYYFNGTPLEFRKEDDNWFYASDKTLVLKQDSMENMLNSLVEIEAVKELEDPAELSEYGLDEPNNTITIMTQDKAYVVLVGKTNGITGQHYIKLDYADEVYLTDTDYDMIFQVSLDELSEAQDGTKEPH